MSEVYQYINSNVSIRGVIEKHNSVIIFRFVFLDAFHMMQNFVAYISDFAQINVTVIIRQTTTNERKIQTEDKSTKKFYNIHTFHITRGFWCICICVDGPHANIDIFIMFRIYKTAQTKKNKPSKRHDSIVLNRLCVFFVSFLHFFHGSQFFSFILFLFGSIYFFSIESNSFHIFNSQSEQKFLIVNFDIGLIFEILNFRQLVFVSDFWVCFCLCLRDNISLICCSFLVYIYIYVYFQ